MGITDMVKTVVAATERGQTEERKPDTEGVGLDASIHADLTQLYGPKMPEERHHPQPGRQLKSKAKQKAQQAPKITPTPRTTSTTTAGTT